MGSIARLLFNLWIAPAFGKFVVTAAILGTTRMDNGLVRKRVRLTLDNAYPVAGYALTAALLGLTQMQLTDAQTGFIDPIVTGVNQSGLLFEVKGMLLLGSYPSGGGQASPTTLAAPLLTAGAVAVTSNAANGANDLTPGVGKALANGTDLSTVQVFLDAVGYA